MEITFNIGLLVLIIGISLCIFCCTNVEKIAKDNHEPGCGYMPGICIMVISVIFSMVCFCNPESCSVKTSDIFSVHFTENTKLEERINKIEDTIGNRYNRLISNNN